MARITTARLALGTWAEAENPGAGSQTQLGGIGLNQNWLLLDDAVGVGHTAAGTHRDDVIGGSSLIGTGGSNVADGSTLEFSASSGAKVLRVKDLGITGAKLAAGIVDSSTIEKASNVLRVKDAGITAAKLAAGSVDETTITKGASLSVKDLGITNAKIASRTILQTKLAIREIIVMVNQSTTSAPTGVTYSDNKDGSPDTITYARTGVGVYTLTNSTAAFTTSKTTVEPSVIPHVSYGFGVVTAEWTSTTVITIKTFRGDTLAASDSVMINAPIRITVYP